MRNVFSMTTMPERKFVLVSQRDMAFLLDTALPYLLPRKGDARLGPYHGEFFVPEGFSPDNPEHALWVAEFAEERKAEARGRGPERRRQLSLAAFLKRTHTFITLDGQSGAMARQHDLPHVSIGDLLGEADFYEALAQAREGFAAWVGSLDRRNFGWSENWPVFDEEALRLVFITACFSRKLACVLDDVAGEVICLFRSHPEIMPAFSSNEIAQTIVRAALPERVRSLEYPVLSRFPEPPLGIMDQDFSVMQGAIVFAVHINNIFRHRHTLRAVREQLGGRMVLACIPNYVSRYPDLAWLREQAVFPGMEPVVLPYFSGGESTLPNLPERTARLQASAQGFLPGAEHLAFVFEDYERHRICALEQQRSALMDIWREHRPALCLAERVPMGEYAVPLAAARALGLPGVSLPHGALSMPRDRFMVPATGHLCCTSLEVMAWKPLAGEGEAVEAFREIDMESTYKSTARAGGEAAAEGGGFGNRGDKPTVIVLVVLGAISAAASLAPFVYPAALGRWLEQLGRVPGHLAGRVRVLYKMHPNNPDEAFLQSRGVRPEDILPLDSALDALLAEASLVLSCEYLSTPGVAAMARNVPVVHCLESENYGRDFYGGEMMRLAGESFLLTRPEALWAEAEALLFDEGVRNRALERQAAVLAKYVWPRQEGVGAFLQDMALTGRVPGEEE